MKTITKTPSLFIALFSVFFCAISPALSATVTEINPISNATNLGVIDISNDGSTLLGLAVISGKMNSFIYENNTTTNIGNLGGDTTSAQAISSDGSTIVGYSNSTASSINYEAFIYQNGTMTGLGFLSGDIYSSAYGVSGDGSSIVGQSGSNRSFIYTNGTMSEIFSTLGGSSIYAMGISYDGSVVVGYGQNANSVNRAFKYENSVMTDLGSLGGANAESYAYKISDDNSVIIGDSEISAGNYQAFKYSNGTMTDLGTLGGSDSSAYDLSADGSIIVGASTNSAGNYHAFKYSNDTMTDLGTLGGLNSYATAISSDGTIIAGVSQNSSGEDRLFLYNDSSSTTDSSMIDTENTILSFYQNGAQLYSLLNLKNSLLRNSLSQDCNKFGAKNLCLSIGYRYANTNIHNAQENSTNLKLAYKINQNLRIGTIIDQTFTSSDPQNFNNKNSQPLFGIFANLAENSNELGFNLRVAGAYQNSALSIKRTALENTESGAGNSSIKSSGLSAEISYAAKISNNLKLQPFAGIRQTEIMRSSYVETSEASFPVTYEAVKQKFTTTNFGVKSSFNLNKKTELNLGIGFEYNLRNRVDGYCGSIYAVGSFALKAPNVRKLTTLIDGGVSHEISESKHISGNIIYGTQALSAAEVAMIYLNYSIGF